MVAREKTFGSIRGKLFTRNHSKLPRIQHLALLWTDACFYVMLKGNHLVLMWP